MKICYIFIPDIRPKISADKWMNKKKLKSVTRRSLKFCWQQIPIAWQGASDIPAPPGYGVMPYLLHRESGYIG
ncbi:hypothetical protein BN439_1731 [Erwinia amylovora Ea644]|nr:hypothetical protein BN439_1731 [Erwinia amylovora Ea644]